MSDYKKRRKKYTGTHSASPMEKVAGALDISKDFLAGTVKVTLLGTNEITIEGGLAIIEYTDSILRLNTRSFVLTIKGGGFEVTDLDTDFLRLTGTIESVSYI